MSSLADLPELVGFFGHSRSDDEHADKRLRRRIRSELRLQLGRDLRLSPDTEAIPHGTLSKGEIKEPIGTKIWLGNVTTLESGKQIGYLCEHIVEARPTAWECWI